MVKLLLILCVIFQSHNQFQYVADINSSADKLQGVSNYFNDLLVGLLVDLLRTSLTVKDQSMLYIPFSNGYKLIATSTWHGIAILYEKELTHRH